MINTSIKHLYHKGSNDNVINCIAFNSEFSSIVYAYTKYQIILKFIILYFNVISVFVNFCNSIFNNYLHLFCLINFHDTKKKFFNLSQDIID